jgi:hypothetical protein
LPGETEVKDLDATVVGQEQVLGLEVAMDDSFVVRRPEPLGDLDRALHHPADGKRTLSESGTQRVAREQLGHRIGDAFRHPEIEDGEDGRM